MGEALPGGGVGDSNVGEGDTSGSAVGVGVI
jgi:hypothetical protein